LCTRPIPTRECVEIPSAALWRCPRRKYDESFIQDPIERETVYCQKEGSFDLCTHELPGRRCTQRDEDGLWQCQGQSGLASFLLIGAAVVAVLLIARGSE
jgi:hypothetical protein